MKNKKKIIIIILIIVLFIGVNLGIYFYLKNPKLPKKSRNFIVPEIKELKCRMGQIIRNGKCNDVLKPNDCPDFFKPDKNTENTSCITMNDEEKNIFCKNKSSDMIYYEKECRKVLTKDLCKQMDKSTTNRMFAMIPDEKTKFTSCRELTIEEKKEICAKNNMFWTGGECIEPLKKPEIKITEIQPYHVTATLIVGDFDISLISIKYILEDTEYTGEIVSFSDKEKSVTFKVDKLKEKTKYSVKAKFLTNINNFESPYSDMINFTTLCDKGKYTEIKCKKNYGPNGSVDSIVVDKLKDPNVTSWPFFKISSEDGCGCREMSSEEKIDYCMDKFYPDFKKEDREVEILGNKCVPKIIKLSAPISNKLVSSLNINQNINGEIKKVSDYRLDFPYRLLLSWERPNLNNTGRGIEAAPSQYNIYRKINKKWELIKKIKVEDVKQTTFKWVDGDNKNFPKEKFSNKLQAGTIYYYKVTAINSAGEGKPLLGDDKTIDKLTTQEECSKNFDDKTDKFKGFHQVINYQTNKCAPMPAEQRQLHCESLPMIQEPYPNYYMESKIKQEDGSFKVVKTCAPMVKNLEVPGKPQLEVVSKNSNSIKLKIIQPENKGIPMLSHYYIIWKNLITGETGRLEDVENQGLLGTKLLETNKYIVEHIKLNPGTTFRYTLAAVSINDKVWKYKSSNLLDGRPVGISDVSTVTVTTKYTVPIEIPPITKINESLDFTSFMVPQVLTGKEGGSVKGINLASIVKLKIIKYLLPKEIDLNMIERTELKGTEFIIETNNIKDFNTKNTGVIQVSFNPTNKAYIFIDYNNEPQTIYQYKIFAMNNKVSSWSNASSHIIMTTPTLSPLYDCGDVTNLSFKVKLSTNLNHKKIQLKWDKMVDPNIKRYQKFKSIYQAKSTKYTIMVKNKTNGNNLPIVETKDNMVIIDSIIPGKEYIVEIIVEHDGQLKLSNGFINKVSCNNRANLDKTNKKVLKIKELTQEDCNTSAYSDVNSIVGEDVKMYLSSTTRPYKCIKKTPVLLDNWCKNNKGNATVYWPLTKKCQVPVDGQWKLVLDNLNGPCTSDGDPGEVIRCGGGEKKIKIWKYTEPKFGGKHTKPPSGAKVDNSESKTAYIKQSCNTTNCKVLCEDLEFGKYISNKDVLTNKEYNSNKNCDKQATISSNLEYSKNIIKPCPSCGQPDSKRIVEDICTDGLYGKPNAISCMKRNDIGNIDEWTLKERIRLDNSKNLVNRYSRTKVLPCSNVKWCDWKTSEWNECNKFCGSGMKQRQVSCERQFSCNPAVKPFSYAICNNGECKKICESKFKKWTNVKNSLTEAEFNNNIYCATKAKINPKRTSTVSDCPSCGNPNTKFIKTDTCTDGLYGPDNQIKCNEIIDMSSGSGWKPDGVDKIDGIVVNKYKKESKHSCNLKWCEWETTDWNECSKKCDWGMKYRFVNCPNGIDKCNFDKKPSTSINCINRYCGF